MLIDKGSVVSWVFSRRTELHGLKKLAEELRKRISAGEVDQDANAAAMQRDSQAASVQTRR